MSVSTFSTEETEFIKANYLKLSSHNLAEYLKCPRTRIYKYMRKEGLKVPPEVVTKFRKARFENPKPKDPNKPVKKRGIHRAMYKYAQSLGYRNVSAAMDALGKQTFINNYKASKNDK